MTLTFSGKLKLLVHTAPLSYDRLTVLSLGRKCTVLPRNRARMSSDARILSARDSWRIDEESGERTLIKFKFFL